MRIWLVYNFRGELQEIYESEDACHNGIQVLAEKNNCNVGDYYFDVWDTVKEDGNASSDSGE